MSPLRGFAVHSKVEQTLEKPQFTPSRDFLHHSRLARRQALSAMSSPLHFVVGRCRPAGALLCAWKWISIQIATPDGAFPSFKA